MSSQLGLTLNCTPALRDLLLSASNDSKLGKSIRGEAADLAEEDRIPWKKLRRIYIAMKDRAGSDDNQTLRTVLQSSNIVLPTEPVKKRNPELVARLERLKRLDEERRYNAMVHDVTASERRAQAFKDGGLVTYKDQLSYGLHVIVVMGVFYGIGHLAAGSLSPKPSMRAAGGLLGLVGALLMECTLLIIRTSDYSTAAAKQKQGASSKPPPARPQGKATDSQAKKLQ